MESIADFYLGSHSPGGYTSLFSELIQPPLVSFLLTGPPGNGKEELLCGATESVRTNGLMERFHSCCHPKQLDGIYFHDRKLSVLSSHEPHTLTPKYPLAYETEFPIHHCYDAKPISFYRERIAALQTAKQDRLKLCSNYLEGARAFLKDNFFIALELTNTQKIAHTVRRICHQELSQKRKYPGIERRRFLGAVTPQGIKTYWSTVNNLCKKIYLIHDEFGCASRILMAGLRAMALDSGEEVFTCYCPLQPYEKIDHILLPQSSIGFVTANKLLTPELTPDRRIHCTRFMNLEKLDEKKERLKFNRKAAGDMLSQATACMEQATAIYNQLCEIYDDAKKEAEIDRSAGKLLKQIESVPLLS